MAEAKAIVSNRRIGDKARPRNAATLMAEGLASRAGRSGSRRLCLESIARTAAPWPALFADHRNGASGAAQGRLRRPHRLRPALCRPRAHRRAGRTARRFLAQAGYRAGDSESEAIAKDEALLALADEALCIEYLREEGAVRVPVLLQWCAFDSLISQGAAASVQRFSRTNVELIEYRTLGHFPMWENPDLFTRDLKAFLDRMGGASAMSPQGG